MDICFFREHRLFVSSRNDYFFCRPIMRRQTTLFDNNTRPSRAFSSQSLRITTQSNPHTHDSRFGIKPDPCTAASGRSVHVNAPPKCGTHAETSLPTDGRRGGQQQEGANRTPSYSHGYITLLRSLPGQEPTSHNRVRRFPNMGQATSNVLRTHSQRAVDKGWEAALHCMATRRRLQCP
jgi:hypothetical protein